MEAAQGRDEEGAELPARATDSCLRMWDRQPKSTLGKGEAYSTEAKAARAAVPPAHEGIRVQLWQVSVEMQELWFDAMSSFFDLVTTGWGSYSETVDIN